LILAFSIGFLEVSIVDLLDIALVSFLLFQVYNLMRGSVAVRIFVGFLSLYLIYLVVRAAEMELLSAILGQFMGVGVIAAIILFQQEIRKFLLLLGKTTSFNRDNNFLSNLPWRKRQAGFELDITPLIEAAKSLGGTNTGALIVISKSSELRFYAESGDRIDALVSKRLLISVFNKTSPLHDGALIIHKGRIVAARCVLPVTEKDVPAQFGLRHRAAIGMSETTDTIILVVSEETGQLSLARNGTIYHNLSNQEIRSKIKEYLVEDDKKKDKSKQEKPESEEVVQ
jgi:uncharacterized protein (TIGR00159 family)